MLHLHPVWGIISSHAKAVKPPPLYLLNSWLFFLVSSGFSWCSLYTAASSGHPPPDPNATGGWATNAPRVSCPSLASCVIQAALCPHFHPDFFHTSGSPLFRQLALLPSGFLAFPGPPPQTPAMPEQLPQHPLTSTQACYCCYSVCPS